MRSLESSRMSQSTSNPLPPLVSLGPGGTYQVEYVASGRSLTALHPAPPRPASRRSEERPMQSVRTSFLDWVLGITRLRLPAPHPVEVPGTVHPRLLTRTRTEATTQDSRRSSLSSVDLPSGAGGFAFTEQGRRQRTRNERSPLTARTTDDICSILSTRMEGSTRVLDSEADSHLPIDPRRTNDAWNLTDHAGTRRRTGGQQSHGVRTHRGSDQEGRLEPGQEQGTLFIDC